MSYRNALEAAGAEVLAFEEFGSYQGDWFAKVRVNGVERWIHDYFGSCSGCDAFEADLGGTNTHYHGNGEYVSAYNLTGQRDDCDQCAALHAALAEFGARYLDDVLTQEQAEEIARKNLPWDMDAKDMLAFVQANALPVIS
jgi:hypothetical protein